MGEDMLLKFTVFLTFLSAVLFHSTDANGIVIYSKTLPMFYEFISESTTWIKASRVCVKSNGSLVTVNTRDKLNDMKNIIHQIYNGTNKPTFWIGLHRAPKWTWDGSTEVLKYFDWHPGEPRINDTTKRIGLSFYSSTHSYNWIALSGTETIVKPDRFNIQSFYICQTNLVNQICPFSACKSEQYHCLNHYGSCYYFAKNANSFTWSQANEACKSQSVKEPHNGNKHLAFIKDEATEHAIADFLIKNPYLNGNYWLGASLQGQHWIWPSGEPFAQENQNPFKTTPNACGAIYPNVWGWIDKACSEQHVFICEYAYQPTTTTPTTPTTIPTTTTTRTTTTKATPTTTPTTTPSTTSTTTTPTTTPSTTPTTTTPTTTPSTTPTTTTPTTTPSTTTPTATPSTTPTTTTPTTTPSTTPTTTTPTTTPSTTTPTTTPSTTPTTTTPTTTPSTTPTTTTPTTTPSTTSITTTPTTTPSTTTLTTTPSTTPTTTTPTTIPSTTPTTTTPTTTPSTTPRTTAPTTTAFTTTPATIPPTTPTTTPTTTPSTTPTTTPSTMLTTTTTTTTPSTTPITTTPTTTPSTTTLTTTPSTTPTTTTPTTIPSNTPTTTTPTTTPSTTPRTTAPTIKQTTIFTTTAPTTQSKFQTGTLISNPTTSPTAVGIPIKPKTATTTTPISTFTTLSPTTHISPSGLSPTTLPTTTPTRVKIQNNTTVFETSPNSHNKTSFKPIKVTNPLVHLMSTTTNSRNDIASSTDPQSTPPNVFLAGGTDKSIQIDTDILMYLGIAVSCVIIILVVTGCFIRKRMAKKETVSLESYDEDYLQMTSDNEPVTSEWITETRHNFSDDVEHTFSKPKIGQHWPSLPYDDCNLSGIHGPTTKFNPMYDCDLSDVEVHTYKYSSGPVPLPHYDGANLDSRDAPKSLFNRDVNRPFGFETCGEITPPEDYS